MALFKDFTIQRFAVLGEELFVAGVVLEVQVDGQDIGRPGACKEFVALGIGEGQRVDACFEGGPLIALGLAEGVLAHHAVGGVGDAEDLPEFAGDKAVAVACT